MAAFDDELAELLAVLDAPPRTEPDDTADTVRQIGEEVQGLLDAIDEGTVKVPAAVRRRVEGAVTVLRMVAGAPTDDMLAAFRRAPNDPPVGSAPPRVRPEVRKQVRQEVRAQVRRGASR